MVKLSVENCKNAIISNVFRDIGFNIVYRVYSLFIICHFAYIVSL